MGIRIFKHYRDVVLFVIAALFLAGATLGLLYVTGSATLAMSAVASFALVFVTAVLVLFTYRYTEATTKQVEVTTQQVRVQMKQVSSLEQQAELQREQVEVQREQVEATNRQVKALTNPILNVDIQIIERPLQNVVGVPMPEALEVFIHNVGPGNACEITFDVKEKDDFMFFVGQSFQNFKSLDIIRNGVKRLAPGQRRSLATIFLSPENRRDLAEMTGNEVTLTYKNTIGDSFVESYLLDFSYNFELIKTLSNIPYSTLH
jgi:type III secretory pathway component EscV